MTRFDRQFSAAARQYGVRGMHGGPARSVFTECEPVPEAGCWIAGGALRGGYGSFRPHMQRQMRAHRVAWMETFGPIPEGLVVCHKCDTPACINPDHLFLGTPGDNNADRHAKQRDGRPSGASNGRARLTAAEVASIRNDHRLQRVIADEYGVAQTTVSAIKRGATWRAR